MLRQVRTKSEPLLVAGKEYQIIITYNQVAGIDGYVLGLKFADNTGSMDSAKPAKTHAMILANAIAYRAIQMIKPDLANISILGFYLLTDELDELRPGGRRAKMRVYGAKAVIMQKNLAEKLQYLAEFEVVGGAAWVLSEKPHHAYGQFAAIEKELAKQMRVTLC